ncbi:MAG TPA: sugar ABC transporter permease [Armatimonadota bacterium]|mgnify:CR=1 FL=1|jgi:multiple sugar transport system permease protein|nr:sugar ABC transporter permease [Armatimonadota bacterium]
MNAFSNRIVRRDTAVASAFLAPSFIGLLVFSVIPIFGALVVSLLQWDILTPPKYVGLANYVTLWEDLTKGDTLKRVLVNTVYFTAATVPLSMAISLMIALLLNRKLWGMAAFRVIFFLPSVTSIVALSIVWRLLYNPEHGLINKMLMALQIPWVSNGHITFLPLITNPPGWLGSPQWAMPAIIIMSVWTGLGYNAILYLAGLQGIGSSYYEAARIDGATPWQMFWAVTWPLLSPTSLFIFTMSVIGGFQVFTQIYMMTAGLPTPQTEVYVYQIYTQAFTNFRLGYASALAFALFIVILIVTLGQLAITRRWASTGS